MRLWKKIIITLGLTNKFKHIQKIAKQRPFFSWKSRECVKITLFQVKKMRKFAQKKKQATHLEIKRMKVWRKNTTNPFNFLKK
jgi:hypothetical protein